MKRANKTGSVYKMQGNRRKKYTAVITYYDEEKKRRRKYIGYYKTKKEAQTALDKYISDPYKITGLTFAQAFEKWSEKSFKKGSRQKQASYRAAFKKCSSLHNIPIQEIKLSHLQDTVDRLEGFSRSTIYNVKIVISGIFTYCMRYEYINKDYSRYIELPRSSEKKIHRIFTDTEIKSLWNIRNKSDTAALILILIYTGYRVSELLEMPKKNINMEIGCIIGGGKKTKAGKNRIIPIHHTIRPLIERMSEKNDGIVFSELSYYSFNREFHSLMKILRFEHTIHETRHTFASLLDREGVPESITKRLLGDTFGNITQDIYIHKEVEELRKGIEKIKIKG